MPQYLINIAVGPVQEFIASARKLRDLWYGSFLLSELSKAVACSLHEQGCELIFPAVSSPEDLQPKSAMNVANKILAISPSGANPDEIVFRARSAFRDSWQSICDEALAKANKITGHSTIQNELFQQQVDDAGEFFAAWQEYDETDYKGCRERCEQRLAGRKSLREFSAPSWNGAGKPKSSLDGIRESVFQQAGNDSYIVNKGEQLDALGIVKRFGPLSNLQRPYFDNMSQISSLPFMAGLEKVAGKQQNIQNILNEFPSAAELYPDKNDRPPETNAGWDGWPKGLSTEILFPAILENELRQRDKSSSTVAWDKAARQLKKLWSCTAEPLPYSCLIVGDGDNMGKTLSALKEKEQHKQFSAELDIFAREVHDLLKKYQGQVIYSGGDDVMAYVPLHTAIDCAAAINSAFAASMTKACAGTGISPVPTFSMGLVIVHQHKPLHQILELARTAEHHAKNEGLRNCLTLIQSKRGGSDLIIHGRWQTEGKLASLPSRLNSFVKQYEEDKLPSRLGYQLRGIVKECGTELKWVNNNEEISPDNITTAEAIRVIGRKRQKSGKELAPEDAAQLLAGQHSLREAADELVIAHQISAACKLATGSGFKQTGTKGEGKS